MPVDLDKLDAEYAHLADQPVIDRTEISSRLRRSHATARPFADRSQPLFVVTRPRGDRYVFVLLRQLTELDADAGREGREWYDRNRETLTVDQGSEWINRLKAKIETVRNNPQSATVETRPNVWGEWRALAAKLCELGGRHGARFAVDTEDGAVNKIAFWWIVPNTGPQGTRYFIRQVIGGRGAVRVRMSPEAMISIGRKIEATGAEECMRRFGREIGSCGHCGRELTNDESRARGIGPVCEAKHG